MTNNIFIIGSYKFNLEGLEITYSNHGHTTHLTLCPKATCQLFQDAGLIEGFDIDQNGEPVILFTDSSFPAGYGFDYWNSFVCFFRLTYKMAVKLMEYWEDRKGSKTFQAAVSNLLRPLAA
jgi:hypothetical protein